MALSWKDKVMRNFDTQAHLYDQYGDVQAHVADSLACDLPCLKNAAILETGCGTGFLTAQLARKYAGHQLHITDVSPRMLEQTKSRFSGMSTRFFILDAEKEQTGETYDLITASMVCQWFEDLEEGLDNLKSMLKPDGTFYFSLPGPDCFKEWRSTLDQLGLPSGMPNFSYSEGIYREEKIKKSCRDSWAFLSSLKNMGASCGRENYAPLTLPQIKKACAAFDSQNFEHVTWHILYGCITKA
ncbi:MAG: methyltransferase [Alphaproteobacteria bacterium]|nr:methyltransferase [Alphaproteobacteria bacterium]